MKASDFLVRGPSWNTRTRSAQSQESELLGVQRAAAYRRTADQARAEGNTALAALNYRLAATLASRTADGAAARQALAEYQKDAEGRLREVQQLVGARDLERASSKLAALRRDYAALPLAKRFEQLRRQLDGSKGRTPYS